MAKDKDYIRMIHTARWLRLRRDKLTVQPLCERCEEEGRLAPATEVHHVLPVASADISSGLWKGKGVTGLSISISAEGLRFYDETESGYEEIAPLWGKGASVEVQAFKRGNDSAPYVKGNFVIASLEETSPAQDDATYSISLENDGEPEIYPGKTATGTTE